MARISILYALLVLSSLLCANFAIDTPRKARLLASNVSSVPLPPSNDPFYTAPAEYENAAPGAVLRVRSAPWLATAIANCSTAYNILYRTTDSNYEPAWAVTTLLIPKMSTNSSTRVNTNNTTTAPGSALLSFQVSCQYQIQGSIIS